MARSLVREDQIGDVDNMSEPEHDEWIHVNLITSGTVTFTNGNVSGTGDIYAGSYYGDGSNLTGITGASGSYLNQDGSTQLTGDWDFGSQTISGTGDIYCDDLYASNNTIHIGDGEIKSTLSNIELYYNDNQVMRTQSNGILILDANNTGVSMNYSGNDNFIIQNTEREGTISLRSKDSDGNDHNLIYMDPDASTVLYHDGNQKLRSSSSGIWVYNYDAAQYLSLLHISDTAYLSNTTSGGGIILQTSDGQSSFDKYLEASFTGVDLFYQGTKSFSTGPFGTTAFYDQEGTKHIDVQVTTNGNTYIFNQTNSSFIELGGRDSVGGYTTLFRSYPDGATRLYHKDALALQTHKDGTDYGIEVGSDSELILVGDSETKITSTLSALELECVPTASGAGTVELSGHSIFTAAVEPLINAHSGATTIYYEGDRLLQLAQNRMELHRPDDQDKYTEFTNTAQGLFYITNYTPGQGMRLRAVNSGDTTTHNMFEGDPDGSTDLYYNGLKTASTSLAGFDIYDSLGSNPLMYLTSSSGTPLGEVSMDSNGISMKSLVTGDGVQLWGKDFGGNQEILLWGDYRGVSLYQDNVIALSTISNGLSVHYGAGTGGDLHMASSSVLQLVSRVHGAGVKISGEDASGSEKDILWGDPDTNTAIYNQGNKAFATESDGIRVYDTSGDDPAIKMYSSSDVLQGKMSCTNGGLLYIKSDIDSSVVQLLGNDSSSVEHKLLQGSPDGAVDLYYDGKLTFATNANGISVADYSGATPTITFTDDAFTAIGSLKHQGSYMWLQDLEDNGAVWLSCDNGTTTYWAGLDWDAAYFGPSPTNTLSLGKSGSVWKDVWATDTTINTSDSRLKDVLGDSLGLDFINRINTVTYSWKDGTRPHQGVVAQEVKEVIDDLGIDFAGYIDPYVIDYPDGWTPPASGIEGPEAGESEPMLGMRYTEFIAPLIKSVQELTDIINIQQATISGLESRIETLEA